MKVYWYSDEGSIQLISIGRKVGGIGFSMDTGPSLYF